MRQNDSWRKEKEGDAICGELIRNFDQLREKVTLRTGYENCLTNWWEILKFEDWYCKGKESEGRIRGVVYGGYHWENTCHWDWTWQRVKVETREQWETCEVTFWRNLYLSWNFGWWA